MKEAPRNHFFLIVLLLLSGPFFLNDFVNIYVNHWQLWLSIDYIFTKLLPGLLIIHLLLGKSLTLSDFGLSRQPMSVVLTATLVAGIVAIFIDQNAYALVAKYPGYRPLGSIPAITNSFWAWFDLSIGLLLVGVVEELVFRGYMCTVLTRYTRNPVAIVVISAIFFGLIHWSLGLHAVLITTLIGAVFMLVYLWSRSLPAIMLAHFLVNFVDFSGLIPKTIFKIT